MPAPTTPAFTAPVAGATVSADAVATWGDSVPLAVPTPPAAGSANMVQNGGKIVGDWRAGAIQLSNGYGGDLQAVTDWAGAVAVIDPQSFVTHTHGGVTLDVDGAGTNALYFSMPAETTDNVEYAQKGWIYLPTGVRPTHYYMQLKNRLGRSTTGSGTADSPAAVRGTVDAYHVNNPNFVSRGQKCFRFVHDALTYPDATTHDPSFDLLWSGTGESTGGPSENFSGSNSFARYNVTGAGNVNDRAGTTHTYTIEVIASSGFEDPYDGSDTGHFAKDGTLRMWLDNTLVYENTAIDVPSSGLNRYELLRHIISPVQDQTEYIWDLVIWSA